MYFLLVHLKHAAIERMERELQSKRDVQRNLSGRLVAMEEFSRPCFLYMDEEFDTERSAIADQLQETTNQVNTSKNLWDQ